MSATGKRSLGDFYANVGDVEVDPETGRRHIGPRHENLCDFCCWPLEAGEEWTYPTGPMEINLKGHINASSDDWGACVPCHELIEAEDWRGLMRRITRVQYDDHGMPFRKLTRAQQSIVLVALADHLARWRAARTGPAYQGTPYD